MDRAVTGLSVAVRELNDNAEQVTTCIRLAAHLVDRVFALRLRSLHQATTKADLFDFFRRYSVACNVVNSVLRPDEFLDPHSTILPDQRDAANDTRSVPLRGLRPTYLSSLGLI